MTEHNYIIKYEKEKKKKKHEIVQPLDCIKRNVLRFYVSKIMLQPKVVALVMMNRH